MCRYPASPQPFRALGALLSVFLLGLLGASGLSAQKTLLHVGTLIDATSETVKTEQTIVVENGKIVGVEDGYRRTRASDHVVDLRDQTAMPGFMDMHVHLTSESGPQTYADRTRLNPEDYTIRGVVFAKRTLLAGFTTVRDLGTEPSTIVALRNAINQGLIPGPRIFAATSALASTGGHGDRSNGLNDALRGDPGPEAGIVNGIEDARKAVRQRYKEGADLIKITATGGVLSLAKNGQNPQFTVEEIRAIVDTAADYGFMVAAHAHGTEGIKRAILGGVRTIEHGTYMDEEAFEMMKEHGTYYVPTIFAGRFVAEKSAIEGFYPDVVRPKAAAIGPVIQGTFAKAYRAGVPIVFGTDCGVCPHGENAKEFQYMVEGGMPAIEAILAATKVPAKLLGLGDELGTIEKGKTADIVAVPGNPLDHIELLQQVSFVMKDGVVYKVPTARSAATSISP